MSMNARDKRKLIDKRMGQQGGLCHYCARKMCLPLDVRLGTPPRHCVTVDHVTPKALGGSDAWLNLVACCRRCNEEKAALSLGDWDAILSARFEGQLGS